jgi:acyl-CoA thioester hydrolase
MSLPSALCGIQITVRWSDMDALGHVNNAVYATYVEEARIRWLTQMEQDWQAAEAMPVVVAQHINYRSPIVWPNAVEVNLTLDRLGTSSLTMGFSMYTKEPEPALVADGHSVLVWVSRQTGKACGLPQTLSTLIASKQS